MLYRFRFIPGSSGECFERDFASDDEALAAGRATLAERLQKAAARGERTNENLQVLREDGTLVGIITPVDD